MADTDTGHSHRSFSRVWLIEAMNYPEEFSEQAQAVIEAARIRADARFNACRQRIDRYEDRPSDSLLACIRRYVLTVSMAFAAQACELGLSRIWPVTKIVSEVQKFMNQLATDASYKKRFMADGHFIDVSYTFQYEILPHEMARIEQTAEWVQYQQDLLKVADLQSLPQTTSESPDSVERRGYRQEIRAWMQKKRINSVKDAARIIGVSESTLKSIMSAKGPVRYGLDTLKLVLDKIGNQERGE